MTNKQKVNKLLQETYYKGKFDPKFTPGILQEIMEIFEPTILPSLAEKIQEPTIKKIPHHKSVRLTTTKAGQREILREHTNKINELVQWVNTQGIQMTGCGCNEELKIYCEDHYM